MEKKQYMAPEVSVTVIEGMTIMAGSLNPKNAQGDLGISRGETLTTGWASSKHYDVWADDEEQ